MKGYVCLSALLRRSFCKGPLRTHFHIGGVFSMNVKRFLDIKVAHN